MRFEKLLAIHISQNHTDTGRKLNVHKMFRRRPRRLLNVLCTLNLRPVSTGTLLYLVIIRNRNILPEAAIRRCSSKKRFIKS